MQYDKLESACKQKGTSVSALLLKMGMSKGNISNWKRGVQPKYNTVVKMAELLQVPVATLLSQEEQMQHYKESKLLEESIKKAARVCFNITENKNKPIIIDDRLDERGKVIFQKLEKLKSISDDDYHLAVDYLDFLIKRRENQDK